MQPTPLSQSYVRTRYAKVEKEIYAYTLMRSVCSQRLFNVCAVDEEGEFIVVVESDLDFDTAAAQVETLNGTFGTV